MRKLLVWIQIIFLSGCAYNPHNLINVEYGHDDLALEIARDHGIAGKWIKGKCWDFAVDLHTRLDENKLENMIVVYDWRFYNFKSGISKGRHAFVVFFDKDKNPWAVDNQVRKPVALIGSNPYEYMISFETINGGSNMLSLVDVIGYKELAHEW